MPSNPLRVSVLRANHILEIRIDIPIRLAIVICLVVVIFEVSVSCGRGWVQDVIARRGGDRSSPSLLKAGAAGSYCDSK